MQLFSIYVHFKSRFQLDRIMFLINCNLLYPPSNQSLIKLGQIGSLPADKILQFVNTADLLVAGGGVALIGVTLVPLLSGLLG